MGFSLCKLGGIHAYVNRSFNNKDVSSWRCLSPGLADWFGLVLRGWGPLRPSSVLGDCGPEPAEEATTRKQSIKSLL